MVRARSSLLVGLITALRVDERGVGERNPSHVTLDGIRTREMGMCEGGRLGR